MIPLEVESFSYLYLKRDVTMKEGSERGDMADFKDGRPGPELKSTSGLCKLGRVRKEILPVGSIKDPITPSFSPIRPMLDFRPTEFYGNKLCSFKLINLQ